MGYLADEVRRALSEGNKKQVDIEEESGGVVKQSVVSSILRGMVPTKAGILKKLAQILNLDDKHLLKLASMDSVKKILENYETDIKVICKQFQEYKKIRLNCYKFSELHGVLSPRGYPEKPGSFHLDLGIDYGNNAYGVVVEDHSIIPKANPGDVVVISQRYGVNSIEDYGIIGTSNSVMLGVIRDRVSQIVVQVQSPYDVFTFDKKDVRFVAKIVATMFLAPEMISS